MTALSETLHTCQVPAFLVRYVHTTKIHPLKGDFEIAILDNEFIFQLIQNKDRITSLCGTKF